jgi:resuscitation-promoting factor RpfA
MTAGAGRQPLEKGPDAFRTIGEAAEEVGVPPHVLRFWESKFSGVRPITRAGGRRYYRPRDIDLLHTIKRLLYDDGLTIRGAQKLLQSRQRNEELAGTLLDQPAVDEGDKADNASVAEIRRQLRALATEAREVAETGDVPLPQDGKR